ncbi:MAG TPA: ATP-binding cassette domain-containing protein, partial [Terriglobia bacterium]|nr:ATP-binding cassette domain-containing protein [Terriglobia bacterium]
EVSLEGVQVERDGRVLLDVPTLLLRGGRTTAILGPNGSGKTTLLRVIAGLDRPGTGRVRIGGLPAHASRVAYVFQEQVFLRRSVRDNLELGLRLRGLDPAERRVRMEEAARLLGITHLMVRRADRLSGGEGRRVSLARALCLRAPLVLLDEPLEGLDRPTYSRLLHELPQLLAAFDATRILVTHNPGEAVRLAEDLVVLVDGRVHASGEKRDVATNPRVPEVAEALGYFVVMRDGRRIAIPPDALRPGSGGEEFLMEVDEVVDLVASTEIAGRIGEVRVHVEVPAGSETPAQGDRIHLHADRFFELS